MCVFFLRSWVGLEEGEADRHIDADGLKYFGVGMSQEMEKGKIRIYALCMRSREYQHHWRRTL